MYNEYPDLIYEGLLYDSLNSEILEEGFGESIKNGFTKLKTAAKTIFNKIIEKLKQFVANVQKFINKIKDKFKKTDNNSDSDNTKDNTKNNSNAKNNSNTKNNSRDDKDEDYPINYGDDDDNYRVYDDEVEVQEKDPYDEPLYNRNARVQRKRKLNGSYSANRKKVKLIMKYNINLAELALFVFNFKKLFKDIKDNFRHIIKGIEKIENHTYGKDSNTFYKSWTIKEDSEYNEVNMGKYAYIFEQTDEEILPIYVLNYGSDKEFELEIDKKKAYDFSKKMEDTLISLKDDTNEVIQLLESSRDGMTKAFEIIDKKITNSQIKKQKIPTQQKDELRNYKELGNKLREQHQKAVRVSSLLIKIQNILVNNISSIRVVEID